MAATASSRLSRLFVSRKPASGRRPPSPTSSLKPSPSPSPGLDVTLNPKASGNSTSSSGKASPARRRLSRVAVSVISEPDLDRVVTIFKECSSVSHFRQNPRIFDLVVRRLAAAGRRDGVAEILEAQKAYPKEFSKEGFAARIISLYGTAKMPDHALAMYRELPSLGCPPSIRCLNAVLFALIEAGDHTRAFEVFREECSRVPPSSATYSVLTHGAMNMGDLEKAFGFFRKINEEKLGPATIAFNTIYNGLCKAGRLDEAEKLWGSMAEVGVEPDIWTFNARIRHLVAGGNVQGATELLPEMTNKGVKPDAFSYAALIDGNCKHGDVQKAKKLFEEMPKKGCSPNQWTYHALVPKLCETGDLDLAMELCVASMNNKSTVTVEVLVLVADALVASGRLAEARKLLEKARSKNYYRNSLDALAKAEERAAEVSNEP